MSSSERATAARVPADPIALEAGRSVAALFDVLERAGGGAAHPRSPSRRPADLPPRRRAQRRRPHRSAALGAAGARWPARSAAPPSPRRARSPRCPPRPRVACPP